MQQLFTAKNVTFLLISVGLLVLGYFLMTFKPAANSIAVTIGPLIVVGVYCVLLPFAIMVKDKDRAATPQKK